MTTPEQEIQSHLENETNKYIQRVIASLKYVGEDVINGIREGERSNWIDQTGNLRSSIGYILTMDGTVLTTGGFKIVKEGQTGSGLGMSYALKLAKSHPKGIALVVVAGMEYASYVEAMKNKTVLADSELYAENLVSKLIQEINQMRAE